LASYNPQIFSNEIMNTFINLADTLTTSETDIRILKHLYKLILFNPKIIAKFDIQIQVNLI